jgi:hypothetical protein
VRDVHPEVDLVWHHDSFSESIIPDKGTGRTLSRVLSRTEVGTGAMAVTLALFAAVQLEPRPKQDRPMRHIDPPGGA